MSGRVNAATLAVPSSNDYLVVFEAGLFLFALLLAKVGVRAFAFQGDEEGKGYGFTFSEDEADVERAVLASPDILRRFQEVVLAYLLVGEPGRAPQYFTEGPNALIAGELIDSMELFVMGHEYAHVFLGHLARSRKQVGVLAGEEVQEVVYTWQQEFEADLHGCLLMLAAKAEERVDPALSFWGSDFFFSCVDIIQRARSIMTSGDETSLPSTSHPPPAMRREALRQGIADSGSTVFGESALALGRALELTLEILWKRTRPHVLKLFEIGKELAPVWR
jgi:hypothetical protein